MDRTYIRGSIYCKLIDRFKEDEMYYIVKKCTSVNLGKMSVSSRSFAWGELLSSVGFMAGAKYVNLVTSLVCTGILARILEPRDFGVISLASLFIAFFSSVTTVGIGPAVVQNNDLNSDDIQKIFALSLYIGLLCGVIIFFVAPILGDIYESCELTNVFRLLAISVFFFILGVVPDALARKALDFKFIASRAFVVHSVSAIIAILLALNGFGLYSLLASPILGSLLIFIFNYKRYPVKLQFKLSLVSIKKIFSFSVFQILFNLTYLLYRNLDKILIGKFFSLPLLGFYEKSFYIIMIPIQNTSMLLTSTLHPFLAKEQNNLPLLQKKYVEMATALSYIGFVIAAGVNTFARELVYIVFGEKWIASIVIIKILSLTLGVFSVQTLVGPFFQATNNTRGMFRSSLWSLLIIATASVPGIYSKSTIVLASSMAIAFIFIGVVYHYYLFKESLELPFIKFFEILFKPFWVGVFVGIYFELFNYFFIEKISNIYWFTLAKLSYGLPLAGLIFFIGYKNIIAKNKI